MHGKALLSVGVDAILSHHPQPSNKTKVSRKETCNEDGLEDRHGSPSIAIVGIFWLSPPPATFYGWNGPFDGQNILLSSQYLFKFAIFYII